ncbi:hypothetical protein JHK87_029594 [Glycine soja]|nr:hypothetical protein JHK87_029594 [Glycine soja]
MLKVYFTLRKKNLISTILSSAPPSTLTVSTPRSYIQRFAAATTPSMTTWHPGDAGSMRRRRRRRESSL